MSFDTERVKSASRKIYLMELDLPLLTDTFYSAQAGIWQIPVSPNLGEDGVTIHTDDGYDLFFEEANVIRLLRIGSLNVDTVIYSQQSSITGCISQNESFYYDADSFMLFVHFDGFTTPWGKIVKLGAILAFSNVSDSNNNIYYDDIAYDTRILSIPELSKMRDNLFYGILQYSGGTISLNNADGYFETLIQEVNIFGQPVRFYMGFDGLDFDDFRQIYEGIVDDYKYNRDTFDLNIVDAKKFFSRKIPINQFLSTDYPDLKSENYGKVKPVAWGNIRNAPLVCLNEASTAPSTYTFYIADTTYNPVLSVSDIYINSKPLSSSKWSFSTQGFVYVSSDASTTDSGNSTLTVASYLSNITADFVSYSTETLGMDVISDVLRDYAFISTDALTDNYDSTEWATSLLNSREVGVYVNSEVEINKVIQDVCVAEDGYLLVLDDGRFTFRRDSITYDLDRVIYTDEWINDPEIEYKREEYLTSIKVKYDKNQQSNTYRSYVNTEYESTSYQKYKTYSQIEVDTVLTSTTDVDTKANMVMIYSKDIIPTVTRKIKMQHVDLEVGDIILAEHSRLSESTKTWANWQLRGISKDLNANELTWTMRWVEDSTGPVVYTEITYLGSTITYSSEVILYYE